MLVSTFVSTYLNHISKTMEVKITYVDVLKSCLSGLNYLHSIISFNVIVNSMRLSLRKHYIHFALNEILK